MADPRYHTHTKLPLSETPHHREKLDLTLSPYLQLCVYVHILYECVPVCSNIQLPLICEPTIASSALSTSP